LTIINTGFKVLSMKKYIIVGTVATLIGLGVATLQAAPNTSAPKSTAPNSQDLTQTGPISTSGALVSPATSVTPKTTTSTQSTLTAPVNSSQGTTEVAPDPVTVVSATKRTETNGYHKDYYCDLTYSDDSTGVAKVGQSNDTNDAQVTFSYSCDSYIGQAKN
jgi:hypothetical protein